MKGKQLRKIYIDTNVLINYCTNQIQDRAALEYIFRARRKEILFTSSLALVQTIANLQTKKKNRKAFDREETESLINNIVPKLSIIDMSKEDVKKGLSMNNNDIEDNIHYVLASKLKCDVVLTNNVSDFAKFTSIEKISPKMGLSLLKTKIK